MNGTSGLSENAIALLPPPADVTETISSAIIAPNAPIAEVIPLEQLLSLRQAAAIVGVHHTTLGRAVRLGRLTPATHTPGGQPRFRPDEVAAYATTLQSSTAVATQRSRYRRLRRTMLLLASELRPQVVLQRIAEEARRLVPARYAALGVMDDDGTIREFYTVGITRAERQALGALPQGRGLLGELFQGGQSVRVADIDQHPRSVGFPPHHPPMRSLLGVPILAQGHNVGNIYLTDRIGAPEFSREDQALVEEMARYAAVAIHNAAMYQESRKRGQQWAALQNIASRITLELRPGAVLRQVVIHAKQLLDVDGAFISLYNPRTGRLRTAFSRGIPNRRQMAPFPVARGAGNMAISGRQPVVIEDYATDPRFDATYKQRTARLGLVSLIVAPLEARGNRLGALYLGTRQRRKFEPSEVELVSQLASLAAIVLDNARQYEAERAAHARAQQAEARLHTVLQHEPEAVVVINQAGRVTMANEAAGRLFFGESSRRLQGRTYPFGARILTPDGAPIPREAWPAARCLAGEGPCLGEEYLLERPDSARVPVLINAVLIAASDADPGGVVVVLQDISRLKEVERMKNDFMAMISHDLKSPLTTIKGVAGSVQLNAQGDTAVIPLEWAKVIEAEVDRLTELVDNLLDMSRIESGAMPLDLEECHLADLAPDCVWRVAQGDDKVAARIHVDVPNNLPPLLADYLQLQRVMCNLLSNALKYSDDGSPIELRAHAVAGGQCLVVEVADHGSGIPPNEVSLVFDKFYRGERHATRGGRPGSGLGLAICQAIVAAHGGTIAVTSEVGRGSTFSFALPFEAAGPAGLAGSVHA